MEELIKAVANLGFPIAISIFLLVRVESKMEKLTESINKLSTSIAEINVMTQIKESVR